MATNEQAGFNEDVKDPINGGQLAVLNTEFSKVSRAVNVDVTATVAVEYEDGSTQSWNLAAGVLHPLRCVKITSFGSATVINVGW